MPKTTLRQENIKFTTRSAYTTVEAVLTLTVDGRELPALATLGTALEDSIELIQNKITESYKVVPERV